MVESIVVKGYPYGVKEIGKISLDDNGELKIEGIEELGSIVSSILANPLKTADVKIQRGLQFGIERDFNPEKDSLILALFYNIDRKPLMIDGKRACFLYAPR